MAYDENLRTEYNPVGKKLINDAINMGYKKYIDTKYPHNCGEINELFIDTFDKTPDATVNKIRDNCLLNECSFINPDLPNALSNIEVCCSKISDEFVKNLCLRPSFYFCPKGCILYDTNEINEYEVICVENSVFWLYENSGDAEQVHGVCSNAIPKICNENDVGWCIEFETDLCNDNPDCESMKIDACCTLLDDNSFSILLGNDAKEHKKKLCDYGYTNFCEGQSGTSHNSKNSDSFLLA
ncbi:MAG: hypothetical protein KKF44_04980 [Nanoarchaeota archaeon]|nr:hypothetical protein [Nanoarchaeota archaeon]